MNKEPNKLRDWFRRFAMAIANGVGSPWAFISGVLVILLWGVAGPLCGFSDTWQLVINTGTTIVTFLIVFLIQYTQNRDGRAIQLKLDELIRAVHGGRNRLVELEECTDEELDQLKKEFQRIRGTDPEASPDAGHAQHPTLEDPAAPKKMEEARDTEK